MRRVVVVVGIVAAACGGESFTTAGEPLAVAAAGEAGAADGAPEAGQDAIEYDVRADARPDAADEHDGPEDVGEEPAASEPPPEPQVEPSPEPTVEPLPEPGPEPTPEPMPEAGPEAAVCPGGCVSASYLYTVTGIGGPTLPPVVATCPPGATLSTSQNGSCDCYYSALPIATGNGWSCQPAIEHECTVQIRCNGLWCAATEEPCP